ncbi:unnamed protein product [Vitrella brassicaformis CCMP3155]|uniref:Uncharacterized protein n=2 Tax=Vitrella brassicaformis TaxID=1169539 RepID=A0A0G4G4V7_VITBC|nr:unnamed protein product [Vitrella brassicaformis CCMP3155]|eukprot:CEM23432.1 unnamed protein product [Vitrella brassicaformis CCMP3155]
MWQYAMACGSDASAASDEAIAAVFKAIRLQFWSGIALPRELHLGVYAFVTPVWCLKPPLPSPLSGAVLEHYTELVIDSSNTRERIFWSAMTPQTAYELGKQMINLKCLIHRCPQTPDGAEGVSAGRRFVANGWCRGLVIALVEGHVAGRQAAREKERPATTMAEGSLRLLTFEAVVLPDSGRPEINQLATINPTPPAAAPSQSISLLALTDVKGGIPGPLANLRRIPTIKLYEIESTDIKDGLRDLQKCLLDRGCSKSISYLHLKMRRSDCHWLLLNNYATFKALASLIDATCSPSGAVNCYVCPSGGEIRDIPLTHLLGYTRFGKVPGCGPQLLSALLTCYNVRMKPQQRPPGSPSVESCIQGTPPSAYHYAWTVTQDQVARPYNGPIDKSLVDNLMLEDCGGPAGGISMSIECEQGWTPPADAIPPEPPEFKAFKADGLVRVKSLTVKSRIGLGVAKLLLRRGPNLQSLQLMDMAVTDVLDILRSIRPWKMPERLTLERLSQEGDSWRGEISLGIQQRMQKVKMLLGGEVAALLAAATRLHMSAICDFTICGSEREARQALVNGGGGTIGWLHLGYVSETSREIIKAEDEREGITLGDHKDQMPHIKKLDMYLDVPSADVVDPGVFILSSIWSLLEIESISQLTVALPQHSHLDALNKAIERRFRGRTEIEGKFIYVYSVDGILHLFMTSQHIAALRMAAFVHSSAADVLEVLLSAGAPHRRLAMITSLRDTVNRLSSMLKQYLPSHDANIAADALAIDFAGRIRAAAPMTVVDPPYAPRRLKAPLMAVIQRHGLVMEPMKRLHGDGPCIPSPSVTASAAQLMAVLQTTGIQITGIELLHKATVHGFAYTDMLDRVGDASCLLFLVRANRNLSGCFIDASVLPPPQLPTARVSNDYEVAALVFKTAGLSLPTFQSPLTTPQCVSVLRRDIEPNGVDQVAKLIVGLKGRGLRLWALDPAASAAGQCRVEVIAEEGRVKSMVADEIEVLLVLQAGL